MNCLQFSVLHMTNNMCNKASIDDSSCLLLGGSSYALPFCMDDDDGGPPQAALTFHLPTGGTQQVVVEENLRCIDLCHLLTLKLNVARSPTWTIVERIADLNIERSLEDHEEVLQVYASWGKEQSKNKFIFRQDFRKYEFFDSPLQFFSLDMVDFGSQLDCLAESTDLAKLVTLQNLLNQGDKCPVVHSQLWCQESGKQSWKRSYFHVENSDISVSTSGLKEVWQLKHILDLAQWNIYTPLGKNASGPTKYQFCLRTGNNDLMWFCSDSEQQRQCWIIALRLAKFGKKLRENYKEAKSRYTTSETASPWVAMDFTGSKGRVIDDPQEAQAIAAAEAHSWKRKLPCCRSGHVSPSPGEFGIEHTQPWFYSGMSRDEATQLLLRHGTVDGVFLVRHSFSKPGNFVLCYAYRGKVHHVQVIAVEEKDQLCYSLDGGRTKFYDLLQLVEFYQLNLSYLPTKLTHFLVHHAKDTA
ncbi:growth factor receptor-bound protein 14-like isoform X2 [Ornithodoros turicata]